jgi:hypothetical protein
LALATSCFQLAQSARRIAVKGSGELLTGSPPSLTMRSRMSGFRTIFAISVAIGATISV